MSRSSSDKTYRNILQKLVTHLPKSSRTFRLTRKRNWISTFSTSSGHYLQHFLFETFLSVFLNSFFSYRLSSNVFLFSLVLCLYFFVLLIFSMRFFFGDNVRTNNRKNSYFAIITIFKLINVETFI